MSGNHPLLLSGVGLSEQVVNGGFPAIFPGCPDSEPRRVGRKRNDFSRIKREEETEEEEEKVVADEVKEEEEESSSIGVASSSSLSEEDEEEEVQSKGKVGAFGSLDSLEESLPIKRGLSNFFSGKSKSFASLSGLSNATRAKDIEKQENPFNKRRRILMAYKIRTASLGSLISASSIASSSSSSLLSPDHTVEEDEEDEDQEEIGEKRKSPLVNHGLFLPL